MRNANWMQTPSFWCGFSWRVRRGRKWNKGMKCAATKGFLLLMCWVLSPALGVRTHLILTENVVVRVVLVGCGGAALRCPHQENYSDAGWCVTGSEQHRRPRTTCHFAFRQPRGFVRHSGSFLADSWTSGCHGGTPEAAGLNSIKAPQPRRLLSFRFHCSDCVRLISSADLVLDVVWCCRGRWPHVTTSKRSSPPSKTSSFLTPKCGKRPEKTFKLCAEIDAFCLTGHPDELVEHRKRTQTASSLSPQRRQKRPNWQLTARRGHDLL